MLNFINTALAAKKVELLRAISPANHVQAKEEWLKEAEKGRFTNPVFTYTVDEGESLKSLESWNHLCDRWRDISPKNNAEELLYDLANDYIERQRLIRTIVADIPTGDDVSINETMSKYYGKTDSKLVDLAYELAGGKAIKFDFLDSLPQKLSDETVKECTSRIYSAEDLKRMFEAVLEDYKLQNTWKVIIDDEHSAIAVSTLTNEGDSRIFIPRTREVSEIKAIQLAGHEIECHVRHNENCVRLLTENFNIPRDIAAKLVSDRDGTITEGFAKISDAIIGKKCTGKPDGAPAPWYIIAADLASKGESFAKITERIHTEYGVALNSCFTYTIRVFRGCHDTSNLHRFSRQADRSYLEGYVEAIALREQGSLLSDFAKFDQATMDRIGSLIGEPVTYLPHLRIAEGIINGL